MDTFQALADPTRRHIIEMLARRGQLSATDISEKFRISPPAVSQHLKVLRQTKIILMEKRAQQRMYQINPSAINEIETWIKKISDVWHERMDKLEALLTKESPTLKLRRTEGR